MQQTLAMKVAAANFRIIEEFVGRTPKQTAAIELKRVKRRAGSETAQHYRDQAPANHTKTAVNKVDIPLRT